MNKSHAESRGENIFLKSKWQWISLSETDCSGKKKETGWAGRQLEGVPDRVHRVEHIENIVNTKIWEVFK